MKDFVIYDCETQIHYHKVEGGWNNVYGHGMSCAATYDSKTDRYQLWGSKDREHLCSYLTGKLVVSFNGIMFDSVLLLGNDRVLDENGVTKNGKHWWINADVYVEMWRNILNMDRNNYPEIIKKIKQQKFPKGVFNLDSVASNTTGSSKSGKGEFAPDLYQQKRHVELLNYVLQDVRVLRDLYMFIKKYKYLVTGSYDIVKF